MRLYEVNISKEGGAENVLKKYMGDEVILEDAHEYWCHGVLAKPGISGDYCIKLADGEVKLERSHLDLNFHDLKHLLLVLDRPDKVKIARLG